MYERLSVVCTQTYIFIYKHTYTNTMEYTHTHTLALHSASHYIIYFPSRKQSYFTQAAGDCLLPNLSGISRKALILAQQNGISGSQFYFWWLLFKFSRPYLVNSYTWKHFYSIIKFSPKEKKMLAGNVKNTFITP